MLSALFGLGYASYVGFEQPRVCTTTYRMDKTDTISSGASRHENDSHEIKTELTRQCAPQRPWDEGPTDVALIIALALTLPYIVLKLPPGSKIGAGPVSVETGSGADLNKTAAAEAARYRTEILKATEE